MPDRPKISVVIPTYNRLHTLPRAVDSVLAQSEQDFELLIVDDASSDGTDRYLATLSDPRIRLFGTRSVELFDRAAGVCAGDPAIRGAELEFRQRRIRAHRIDGREQGRGVDAVERTAFLDGFFYCSRCNMQSPLLG